MKKSSMKIMQRHSHCPDIVVAREERTLIFLICGIACVVVSFIMLVWAQRVISNGNANLAIMKERLNAATLDLHETQRACEAALAVCQQK